MNAEPQGEPPVRCELGGKLLPQLVHPPSGPSGRVERSEGRVIISGRRARPSPETRKLVSDPPEGRLKP